MGTVESTDAQLIAASRRGEHAAFGELVERHHRAVSAVSYARTRDRSLSEDVAQDTFVTAWCQLDRLHDPSRLRPWLCGIARNLASKARRRRAREAPIDERIALAGTPFDALDDRQTERIVADALARVPDTYREPLVMFYYEDRSVPDVAGALGITEDATHQRLSRGRAHLGGDVAPLVERTLAGRRTRRNLAASVLAALPILGTASHVEAATKGPTMLKLAIAATIVTLASTGLAVRRARSTDSSLETHKMRDPWAEDRRTAPGPAGRATPPPTLEGTNGSSDVERDEPVATPVGSPRGTHDCAAAARRWAKLSLEQEMSGASDPSSDKSYLAAMTPLIEKKCFDEHWSQAYIDCAVASNDLWSAPVLCGRYKLHPPRLRPPVSSTTDASCGAVARHIQELSAAHITAGFSTAAGLSPESREAVKKVTTTDFSTDIETSCSNDHWSQDVRQCLVTLTSRAALEDCW